MFQLDVWTGNPANILTVGWEDYKDVMTDDIKDYMEFALKHGWDWLYLDGDATLVLKLPMYE